MSEFLEHEVSDSGAHCHVTGDAEDDEVELAAECFVGLGDLALGVPRRCLESPLTRLPPVPACAWS